MKFKLILAGIFISTLSSTAIAQKSSISFNYYGPPPVGTRNTKTPALEIDDETAFRLDYAWKTA